MSNWSMLPSQSLNSRTQPLPVSDHAPHAVVIGAGFGGLAAALRLSVRGYRVTVVERLTQPGGRARVFRQDGFTFDAGPTVITAPFLFEELWSLCGKRLSDDIDLRSVEPFYRIVFPDGDHFDYTGSAQQMAEQVARWSPADVKPYEAFVEMSKRIFEIGFEKLSHVPFDTAADMARIVPAMAQLRSFESVYRLVSGYVQHPKLRQVLSFHPLLVGGNPFTTSSIYTLIAHLERKWGVYFPMGGTGALVQGLVRLLEERGAVLRYGEEVEEILVEDGRARGLRLASGEQLGADVVVSNADSVWTYNRLLPAKSRRKWSDRRIEGLRSSMGLFVWYFGTDKQYPDVAHHTIALGPRYKELLDDIFKHKKLAADFSLYLHRPTATDPSLAPAGCDAFYVLSPVPHLLDPQDPNYVDWAVQAELYRRAIAAQLGATLMPGLEDHIVSSRLLTPQDFATDYLAFRGCAFGVEPVLHQSAYFRPHNRSEDVENLYLVGAGTHPGAGVPGVLSSARVLDGLLPDAPRFALSQVADADWAACAKLLRRGSSSFYAASQLLPPRLKHHVGALYALLRQADDHTDATLAPRNLAALRQRLDALYAGAPPSDAVSRCAAAVIQAYAIPRPLFDALLEGFDWDLQRRSYETFDELCAYCARVASSVGVMMSMVMDIRDPALLARACDLGLAMQLTNIARDVGEDASRGRLYLPRQWLSNVGIDAERWLAAPRWTPELGSVVRRLCDEAEAFYRRADSGIAALPLDCRPAIGAARHIYAGIQTRLAAAHYNSVDQRVYTKLSDKLRLAVQTYRYFLPRTDLGASFETHPEARFLVDLATIPAAAPAEAKPPRRTPPTHGRSNDQGVSASSGA